jgi:hypothetical protein
VGTSTLEIEVERCERILAPITLVWDEIDSLDRERAARTFHITWGPLKWPLDVNVSIQLTAFGGSETRLQCRGHLETRHRVAAGMRRACNEVVERHVQEMIQMVKVRAEQRRLAHERLG